MLRSFRTSLGKPQITPLGTPLGKPNPTRGSHPADVVPQRLLALLVLPTLHIALHKDLLCPNRLTDCRLAHGQFLRFPFIQFV